MSQGVWQQEEDRRGPGRRAHTHVGGLYFVPQVSGRGGGGPGIQRHVDDGGDPACRGSAGGRPHAYAPLPQRLSSVTSSSQRPQKRHKLVTTSAEKSQACHGQLRKVTSLSRGALESHKLVTTSSEKLQACHGKLRNHRNKGRVTVPHSGSRSLGEPHRGACARLRRAEGDDKHVYPFTLTSMACQVGLSGLAMATRLFPCPSQGGYSGS
jgi:hypothetical protein